MDPVLRRQVCDGVAVISAEIIESVASTTKTNWLQQVNGEVLSHCELLLEHRDDQNLSLGDLHALLTRQNELVSAVLDNHSSGRKKVVRSVCSLTKSLVEQDTVINNLREKQISAEQLASKISHDLQAQREEIQQLKKRYNSAEEQLTTVQETVKGLRRELKLRNQQLYAKEATIRELKHRLAAEERNKKTEQKCQPTTGTQTTTHRLQAQENREKRFAEIRGILNRTSNSKTSAKSSNTSSLRLQALRNARDSRLGAMQSLLFRNYQREQSYSSTSQESLTDVSSLGSVSDGSSSSRSRKFEHLQQQRNRLTGTK